MLPGKRPYQALRVVASNKVTLLQLAVDRCRFVRPCASFTVDVPHAGRFPSSWELQPDSKRGPKACQRDLSTVVTVGLSTGSVNLLVP